jgi:hypothetical protein
MMLDLGPTAAAGGLTAVPERCAAPTIVLAASAVGLPVSGY